MFIPVLPRALHQASKLSANQLSASVLGLKKAATGAGAGRGNRGSSCGECLRIKAKKEAMHRSCICVISWKLPFNNNNQSNCEIYTQHHATCRVRKDKKRLEKYEKHNGTKGYNSFYKRINMLLAKPNCTSTPGVHGGRLDKNIPKGSIAISRLRSSGPWGSNMRSWHVMLYWCYLGDE